MYRTRSVFSWQLFSDCQTRLNEFKVHIFIMQKCRL